MLDPSGMPSWLLLRDIDYLAFQCNRGVAGRHVVPCNVRCYGASTSAAFQNGQNAKAPLALPILRPSLPFGALSRLHLRPDAYGDCFPVARRSARKAVYVR